MRITSLSAWLAACTLASSTCAFSALSRKQQQHRMASQSTLQRSIKTTGGYIGKPSIQLNVAASESIAVSDMERGMGGRLEEAFETAKSKGEAAFVAFITAGYPTKEGTLCHKVAVCCLPLRCIERCKQRDPSSFLPRYLVFVID